MKYDIAIIGAGVIGGMLARELSRYDLRVCLVEKENDVAMGASRANSGIIHGGYDPEPGTLKAKLNTAGVDLLYRAAEELNVPHKNNGSLVCAFGTAEEEQTLETLYRRSFQNGINCVRLLSSAEARVLEPALSEQVSKALYVPNAGIICPYELTIAAVGNAMDNGVTLLRNFAVTAIDTGDGFTLTAADGRQVGCTWLVNCAGGYADRIAAMAGDGFFEIIPRAGEYLLLDKTEGSRVQHTIFQVPTKAGKGILVTPTVDGNLLTGPTALAVESPDSTETTPEGLAQVTAMAAKSVPSVDYRQVITAFTGVRSSEKTGDFIIELSKNVEKFLHVAAIDSPGLTACVSIAKMALELLRQTGLELSQKPCWNGYRENPHTFRAMSEEAQDAYIRENPAYGRIVCRCETVSEGEIADAIRRNPPALDLDGVKRRTRSGMGRCQGGFCAPYVMELLAREQGIALEEVTKQGGVSRMLAGDL